MYNARRERRVCAETCLFFDETGPSWQLLNGENQLQQNTVDPIFRSDTNTNTGIDIINFLIDLPTSFRATHRSPKGSSTFKYYFKNMNI